MTPPLVLFLYTIWIATAIVSAQNVGVRNQAMPTSAQQQGQSREQNFYGERVTGASVAITSSNIRAANSGTAAKRNLQPEQNVGKKNFQVPTLTQIFGYFFSRLWNVLKALDYTAVNLGTNSSDYKDGQSYNEENQNSDGTNKEDNGTNSSDHKGGPSNGEENQDSDEPNKDDNGNNSTDHKGGPSHGEENQDKDETNKEDDKGARYII